MTTVLEEWTKEKACPFIRFLRTKEFPPGKIHCELETVYNVKAVAVQQARNWCRECDSCRMNVKDEPRSGRPSTLADAVQQCKQTGV